MNHKPFKVLHEETVQCDAEIRALGYTLITICELKLLVERGEARNKAIIESFTHDELSRAIQNETICGYCEVTMSSPEHLKMHFSEFQPFYKNVCVSWSDIRPHLSRFAEIE